MSELETFLLDAANRPAATAAQAVADGTGLPFAPLVVLGPAGSGKSDLLDAIRARVLARHPGARVERLNADALAERYRTALVLGRGDACRLELAGADLVLIDDLERLARHRDCQGLVTDLLDTRRAAGRDTVLTTPRPLSELDGLDARLIRRIGEGTTVHLKLPGAAARREILRAHARRGAGTLPPDVIEAVADAEFPSMRDYTGALSRLTAFQQASATPLSPRDALVLIGAPVPAPLPLPESVAPADEAAPPEAREPEGVDEFGAFLSEVQASVSEQVDRWRRRIEDAVRRWSGAGLRTRRLEALLEEATPVDPEPVLESYEADVRTLEKLAAEIGTLAPDLAGAEVFRDPDQVPTARDLVEQTRVRGPLSAPLPQYRLEEYLEGRGNRNALEVVRRLVEQPGRVERPVVIVAAAGLGKTHLLHGTGNALVARGLAPVACLSAQAFAAEIGMLKSSDDLQSWRLRYRWVAALLLDDLHVLVREPRAQEELLRLLDELEAGRRVVVLTTGLALETLPGLDPRLAERLREATVAQLGPPDREIRLAVAKRLLISTPAAQDAGLADYFAGRPAESIRALIAAVERCLAAAASQRVTPSPSFAREVLEAPGRPARPVRASGSVRTSGILSPGLGLVKTREKMIEEWPAVGDYLITELR